MCVPVDRFVLKIMSFLKSHLTSVYGWREFGYNLGFSMNELNQIDTNIGHDVKLCISRILFLWQKRSPGGSHEDVARALKASGYDLLSAMICFQYSQTQSTQVARLPMVQTLVTMNY